MLSKKYLNSVKNLPSMMKKIVDGTAPEKFTRDHLKKLGFTSSYDLPILGILKELGFLSESGAPTQRYHDYRNTSKSKKVLGEALRDAYSEIFHINEKPSSADKTAIAGLFKSTHNVSDQVAGFMANTFLSLLDMADITESGSSKKKEKPKEEEEPQDEEGDLSKNKNKPPKNPIVPNLRYNIEIHLPATKDIEVYNSIFKSLKQNLLDD